MAGKIKGKKEIVPAVRPRLSGLPNFLFFPFVGHCGGKGGAEEYSRILSGGGKVV